jgi:hypothetical protein
MTFLAAAAPYLAVASTALTVGNTIREGQQAKIDSQIKARELREDANARQAESQREAIVRRRQGTYAASRARAVAAASGAGVSDTTADTLIGRIETQSDLNVLDALYEGDTTARGLRDGARTAIREGKAARKASRYKALGSAVSGASSFYSKFGGGGETLAGAGVGYDTPEYLD